MRGKNLPVAFLTTDDLHGHVTDDHLAVAPLSDLGWPVEFVSWRQSTHWRDFAGVVIRTPWDYTEQPEAFMQQLAAIERAGIPLGNTLSMVRWNLDKTYLRKLEQGGRSVVPTQWQQGLGREDLSAACERFNCQELVLKPQLGASAKDTYRLKPADLTKEIADKFAHRACMIQPFLPQIIAEGEYSLFFFAGKLCHAINKRPADGDFRVQEEHGGQLKAITPESPMTRCAQDILSALPESPLYARVDLVRIRDSFALMELELVEPSLYLRLSSVAPQVFAEAIHHWLSASLSQPSHR